MELITLNEQVKEAFVKLNDKEVKALKEIQEDKAVGYNFKCFSKMGIAFREAKLKELEGKS